MHSYGEMLSLMNAWKVLIVSQEIKAQEGGAFWEKEDWEK